MAANLTTSWMDLGKFRLSNQSMWEVSTSKDEGICRSSGYHIRALRHIRKYIDCDSAKSVACALVGARIDYCNSILHGTSQCNIDKLQRLQNSLARAVVGSGRTEPVTPILARLHWLPIKDRIQYKIALLTHKVLTNNQPEYLADLIHYYQPQRQLRSASHRLLHCPTPRTVFGSRAFCFSAPKVWNSLPHDLIDNQLTLASFKRSLKTFLFHRHFACWSRGLSAPAILLYKFCLYGWHYGAIPAA